MRFQSSGNTSSSPEENIPVSLFCFDEKRKFIRVSADYEETIRTLTRAFGIKEENVGRIYLQTSALDVCKNREIVIDESAYPLMWKFLEEIDVFIDYENEGRVSSEATSSRKAEKAPETQHNPLPTPTPEAEPAAGPSVVDDLYDFTSDNQQEMDEDRPMEEQPWEDEEPAEEPLTARVDNPTYDSHEDQPASSTRKKSKNVDNDDIPSSVTSTVGPFPRIKQEKIVPSSYDETPGPSRRERSPKKEHQNAPAVDDPRFEITIIGPDGGCAQFKTRGKHQIRKVLAAACKTFSMDYNRTQLVLGLHTEDGVHEYVCPDDETISACGVSPNAKLYIRERPDQDSE